MLARYVKILSGIALFLALPSGLFAQEDFVQTEMERIQQDFQLDRMGDLEGVDGSMPGEISQEDLVRELMKPGNEHLLEQIKETGRIETLHEIDRRIREAQAEDESTTEELDDEAKKEREEEERRLRSARATLEGLLFEDNYAYYMSIKDFYGYDIFLRTSQKDRDSFGLSNDNYIIGPGDEMVLTLWGDTDFQRNLTVSNDGTIYIRELGIVNVNGYTLSSLKQRMKTILARSFSTINPPTGEPTTHFDISLRKLKSINVFVSGEVVVPGSFSLNSHSTMLDALKLARGVTAKGTLRDILLFRGGEIISRLDIYDYLLKGGSVGDVNLKNGDIVFVGPRLGTIELRGEVLRPLKYELKHDETLRDLIHFSGGLLPSASIDMVTVERILPFEDRIGPVVTTKIYDFEFTQNIGGSVQVKPIRLHNHDVVNVFQVPRIVTDYVAISGAVYRKGRYYYEEDMTVSQLLQKSGGPLSDAFLSRVELVRTHPDFTTEFHSLDLTQGDMNLKLAQRDSIHIHSEQSLKSRKIVLISGHIANPGFYFLHKNMRISDLILTRGGLEDKRHRASTYLERADLIRYAEDGLTTKIIPIDLRKVLEGDRSEDIILQDRDHLRIYHKGVVFSEPKVKITGYVRYEGEYPLSKNMTIEDLVMRAHGFRDGAYKYKAVVFRMKRDRAETDSLSTILEVDIESDFLEKGYIAERNFFLQDNDHVVIRKHPDFEHLRTVTISGHVKFPGVYNLTRRQESFKDIVERAGGLTSEAFIEGTVLQRDSIKFHADFGRALTHRGANIVMRHGDDIHIPKRPGKVKVEGFVYSPGVFTYRSDWTLADYVEAAGGPVRDLEYMLGETIVYYPGGNARVDGWLFSPDVTEGSTIVVEKTRRPPESQWRNEVRQWLGIVTSTITILVLISRM